MAANQSLHLLIRALAAIGLGLLLYTRPMTAWNETGHRVVSAIAYDNLTARARVRVDDLIRRHPDYQTIFLKDAPVDPAARARAAFVAASYWPDIIRNDPRMYDDTRRDAQPTPLLPGFPDMGRHTNWHYVDFNFSEDGTPIDPLEATNALREVSRLIGVLGAGDARAAYSLPWILHLVGDLHNPLHTVSRYSRALPNGDKGGNDVWVRPPGFQPRPPLPGQPVERGVNLHYYWDGIGGSDPKPSYVDRFAVDILREYVEKNPGLRPDLSPEQWVVEGFYNARTVTYKFGQQSGTRDQPLSLSRSYDNESKQLGRKQLSAAGLRLAALLNQQLQ